MANSRIMLVCKHCGENFCIGKGYFGSYSTSNDELHKQLNIFYGEHEHGCCSEDIDCSDNARNHFAILEEGEDLGVLAADVVPKSEVERLIDKWIGDEALTQNEKTLRLIEALKDEAKRYERYYFNHEYDKLIAEAKAEVAREIFEEIEREINDLEYQANTPRKTVKVEELKAQMDWVLHEVVPQILAELKKKYTENENG